MKIYTAMDIQSLVHKAKINTTENTTEKPIHWERWELHVADTVKLRLPYTIMSGGKKYANIEL